MWIAFCFSCVDIFLEINRGCEEQTEMASITWRVFLKH